MVKRPLVWAVVFVLVLVALAGFLLATGGMPLIDGAKLARGRITVVADGFIAAYIVELNSGEIALVDTTMDTQAAAIRRSLENLSRSSEEVTAIFLTHGHGDHIAGTLAFPNAEIYCLAADVDLVEGRRVTHSMLGRFRKAELTGIKVDHPVSDGDVLSVGETAVRVFGVPGHTLGSAAYLIYGVLFLGDSAAARSDSKITGPPPIFSANREEGRQSLMALAATAKETGGDIRALAFGHQGPVDGLAPLIEWADENSK